MTKMEGQMSDWIKDEIASITAILLDQNLLRQLVVSARQSDEDADLIAVRTQLVNSLLCDLVDKTSELDKTLRQKIISPCLITAMGMNFSSENIQLMKSLLMDLEN